MAEPTSAVRAATYERDGHSCVSCGARAALQYQHRQAVGMGGSKRRPKVFEGLASCAECNPRYEADLQAVALRFGWKVKGWVKDCSAVPAYFLHERAWFRLKVDGGRVRLSWADAMGMMRDVYGAAYDVEKGLVA